MSAITQIRTAGNASMQTAAQTAVAADLTAVKTRMQAVWSSGDYAVLGTTLQIVGELLAEAIDVRAGERVLDVAAGNGNATLAAARRGAEVISTDYVSQLLDKGAARARAEGLAVKFQVADAEALPFADGSFDAALSTFGVMFTPDQPRAAGELARVVRPGGRIGLAAWTPQGFLGEVFRAIGSRVPPPAGIRSPLEWGDEVYVAELFGPHARDVRCARRIYNFRYRSPEHWVEIFRRFYGPTHKAFAALNATGKEGLQDDLVKLLAMRNIGGPHSLVVPAEYLEVVITRR